MANAPRIGTLLAGLVAAGCGGTSDTTGATLSSVDCSASAPTFGELTIWPLCTICHASSLTGSARQGAPSNVNFDSFAAAANQAMSAAVQVSAGDMPPPGEAQPTSAQKTALYQWALCGTPN